MAKALRAALAGAAILSAATLGTRAVAMPLAPPAFRAASARAPLIEPVANVCGISGCAPVWTKRVRKPPPGFVTRAAPLVFPVASAPQNPPANK